MIAKFSFYLLPVCEGGAEALTVLVTPYKWLEVLIEDKTHWALTIHCEIHDILFVGKMNKLNWSY